MANRLDIVKKAVNKRLRDIHHTEAFAMAEHLSSVAVLGALLARKRALDPDVCQCAGMLHDLWLYQQMPVNETLHKQHGERGAVEARAILQGARLFSDEETATICGMIARHNDKDVVDGPYEELLKDADALAHMLRNLDYDKTYKYHGRDVKLMKELGF